MMKSNINRRNEIFYDSLPSKGSEAYNKILAELNARPTSPAQKKFFRDCFTKAKNSLEAQHSTNSGFITETTLRHFLLEFNSRAWNHGLRSMPLLFNIMEAFFIYRKPHQYFELFEEENYLISLFDFLDFYTSTEFSENKDLIEDNLAESIIYNFNVGADLEEIKFKVNNQAEFIVSGISILRRGNEVTVMLISGNSEPSLAGEIEYDYETDNPNKKTLFEEFKKETEGRKQTPIFIDENKVYAKTLVMCRLDLQTETIDARFVAEEFEDMFNIQTDEIDTFVDSKGEYTSSDNEEIHKHGIRKVEEYSAIYEVIKSSLYLPFYLNTFEEDLIEESHETEFKKLSSNPIQKRKFRDTFGYKSSFKPLYVLNRNNKFPPDNIKIRDDLFKIEMTGYWKHLQSNEVGLDKKGKSIHGKTWVNKKLSWYEASNDDLMVTKEKKVYTSQNAGYIYIMRNPTMGPNIFKIGLTRNNVDNRAKQLSKTSVPDKFYKAQEWAVRDCINAEARIHKELEFFRIDPRREFFELEYSRAVETISEVCNDINNEIA